MVDVDELDCPGLAEAMALASARARLLEFEAKEQTAEATMAQVLEKLFESNAEVERMGVRNRIVTEQLVATQQRVNLFEQRCKNAQKAVPRMLARIKSLEEQVERLSAEVLQLRDHNERLSRLVLATM